MDSVWVWGDQLNRDLAHLRGTDPASTRVLLVVSDAKLTERRWHVQKAHLVVSAMRHFAAELEDAGYAVDLRRAPSMRAGFEAHVDEHDPSSVRVMEPASLPGNRLLADLDVEVVDNDHFLCHWREFDGWAGDAERLRMEDFYRWRREVSGVLMDGDEPAGGRWNFDHDNRQRPDGSLARTRDPVVSELDALDRDTLDWLPDDLPGTAPDGTWATTRRRALVRLRRFVDEALPRFGDHQDVMVAGNWSLHHALLSHALNLGLLHPREVVEAAEEAYRSGHAPINAVEGFVRQIIGWREFIWNVYRRWMPSYATRNHLRADLEVPPAFTGAPTEMRCVQDTVRSIHEHAYAHHIQRLMVLANLATSAGVHPGAFTDWMHGAFVDAYEWVMVPNVIGMGTFADGGRMSTKPYVSSGAYIDRMSEGYCGDCRYDRTQRTGDDACPFTTLYWDFLARNRDELGGNHRLARPYANLDRLSDVDEVRERAREVRRRLTAGEL
ncbi:cryptochrome/photolyase family protein [Nitriliruptoraceae bacterium ZYF776]|nr:cryptochrome/photolyase family protein [Profundirhabdus halotolerans]